MSDPHAKLAREGRFLTRTEQSPTKLSISIIVIDVWALLNTKNTTLLESEMDLDLTWIEPPT